MNNKGNPDVQHQLLFFHTQETNYTQIFEIIYYFSLSRKISIIKYVLLDKFIVSSSYRHSVMSLHTAAVFFGLCQKATSPVQQLLHISTCAQT